MSAIEWTDKTWNPVTGCTKVSPGCRGCYMHRLYPRLRGLGTRGYEASPDVVQLVPERLNDDELNWRTPKRVFVCSMSDLFHEDVPDGYIGRVFEVMADRIARYGHTFQVLTKRPENAVKWWRFHGEARLGHWPPRVWAGTSVETEGYTSRLHDLGHLPAPVKFLSAEPLLGPLDLSLFLESGILQWVIAGGESGPKARPMQLQWARDLRDQCQAHGVAFFLKQLGGVHDKRGGDKALLDGELHHAMPGG